MTHQDKVQALLRDLDSHGISPWTTVPPPHFIRPGRLFLVFGASAGVGWGFIMWLWDGRPTEAEAQAVLVATSLLFGSLLGTAMAWYYTRPARRLGLTSWGRYQGGPEINVMDEIEAQRHLGDKDLAIFNAEFDRRKRSTPIAYVLLLLFGGAGAHNFYLGKWVWGLFYLFLLFAGWLFVFSGIAVGVSEGDTETQEAAAGVVAVGFGAFIVLGVLLLWDLITLARQVAKRDERLRRELLTKLSSPRAAVGNRAR